MRLCIQRIVVIRLCLLLVLLMASLAAAQSSILAGVNVNSTQERLLFKRPAGPYTVSIDGERLLDRAYFHMDIRHKADSIAADSRVKVKIIPPEIAGDSIRDYTAIYEEGRFVVDPIILDVKQDWEDANWLVELDIEAVAGKGSTTFAMEVYRPKPETNFVFKAVNVALPILVLLIFIGLFSLTRTRLEQHPKFG